MIYIAIEDLERIQLSSEQRFWLVELEFDAQVDQYSVDQYLQYPFVANAKAKQPLELERPPLL